ncbi:hypothetical protein KO02_16510 [Sphingobacterium sp. ML3W]|uniref:hypothetical protein n=1 Tax=Sphingobacterium TaxID=28453 RepID=UPI0004F5EE38|nr:MULTISPECIES: hypothetical protein [Sphingobacterium]AIM38107.1 hypothetical protein KO02_16510 [Sphingobacterium sp. ML3W]MDH5825864.1 hypothetical protein [Sphingobacterium faecium]
MRTWYLFTPKQGTRLDPVDPLQYTRYVVGKKSPSNRDCSDKIYAIKACFDSAGLPIIDESLQREMAASVHSGRDGENIILKQEYYIP